MDLQSNNESPEEIAKRIEQEINAPRKPNIDLPKVDLPKADLPKVDMPNIDLPKVNPGFGSGSVGGGFTPSSVAPINNQTAIFSLVAGIVSWVILPIIAAIAAIILGMNARKEIKNSNGTQTGDTMALIGIILGWANIGIFCVVGLCIVLSGGLAVLGAASSP